MKTPEGRVKDVIKAYLRSLPNCWFFMANTHGYGVNGVPDIVGCYRGVFFAIEVKAPGKLKGVTPLQQMQINEINQAHGWACAADDERRVHEMFALINASLGVAEQNASDAAWLEAEDRNRDQS
jgi:hypothetical protein